VTSRATNDRVHHHRDRASFARRVIQRGEQDERREPAPLRAVWPSRVRLREFYVEGYGEVLLSNPRVQCTECGALGAVAIDQPCHPSLIGVCERRGWLRALRP
jgi:hypothetical protein